MGLMDLSKFTLSFSRQARQSLSLSFVPQESFGAQLLAQSQAALSGALGRCVSRRLLKIGALLGFFGALACEEGPEGTAAWVSVESTDGRSLQELAQVVRLRVQGLSELSPEQLWVVRGELSSVSLNRFRRGDPPQKLIRQRLPTWSWREGAELFLSVGEVLESGERLHLLAERRGVLAELKIAAELPPLLRRQGQGSVAADGQLIYCSESEETEEQRAVLTSWALSQTKWSAGWATTGLLKERCVSVQGVQEAEQWWFPPQELREWVWEPTPVFVQSQARPSEPSWCNSSVLSVKEQLGSCGSVQRGAWELVLNEGIYLLRLRNVSDEEEQLLTFEVNESDRVHAQPVLPNKEYQWTLWGLHQGELSEWSGGFHSGLGSARLVLHEVMVNPRGPEPQAEWIEILNVGSAPAQLDKYTLWDEEQGAPLPPVTLHPGEFGLIVREDFVLAEGEVLPPPETVPVRVKQIGKNGLKNSGEEISLRDAEGRILSRVPALRTPEGVSLARLHPWAPDQADSFRAHGGQGASPGAPNAFD